jgi:hypothetical protein
VPSNVGLLCVNKRINAEAIPVLYGCTKFRFQNACAMCRFLGLIGDNIQCLRDVGIQLSGWSVRCGFVEVRHAIKALTVASALRTFQVAHTDVCPLHHWAHTSFLPGNHNVIKLCKPLLNSLRKTYKDKDMNASILDVIKIDANKSDYEHGWDCKCTKQQRVEVKDEFQRKLKHSIAKQHNVVFE